MDITHLVALQESLSREKHRLSRAKGNAEIAMRTLWVSQKEREIAAEMRFLGIFDDTEVISVDKLFAELS